MKKIYKSIAVAFSLLLFSTGCSDFLDVPSQDKVDAEDSKDVYTPESFVNGTYSMFTDWNYAFSYLAVTEIISDNADKGSSPGDPGGDKQLFDDLTYTSTAGSIKDMWTHWYKSIGRATQAIEFTENYGLTDEAYKNRLIGEAKFLRALNYFFLVRGWGDVPIQERAETALDKLGERVPKDTVYANIEKDLMDAISVLPQKSEYASKDLGRATKGSAQALLSKVYLYQGKWQQAYDNATAVVNSGQYRLESDYRVIWRASANNGVESIFEFQSRGDAPAIGTKQYSQTQGARGTTGWGWGFNTPSQNLLNDFNASNDSIRRDGSIIFRNSILWDGRVIGATENPMYNLKAYSSSAPDAELNDKSIKYIRLGEVYLIQAEAANELGKNSEALTALNTVRTRAKLTSITLTDKDQLRTAIWHERRLELAMEHDRWFDLNRTGQGKTAMAAAGKNNYVVGKHELFPIPNQQLIETPQMKQNPNW